MTDINSEFRLINENLIADLKKQGIIEEVRDDATKMLSKTILGMMSTIEDNYKRKMKKQKMFHEIHPDIQKAYEKADSKDDKSGLRKVVKMLDDSEYV